MLHPFPSKIDVVRAAVGYLHEKRLKAFRRALERGAPPDGDRVRQALEAYVGHGRHPLFVAFFELAVAARTERELAAILAPAHEVFADWRERGLKLELALDPSRTTIEGMALGLLMRRDPGRDRRLPGDLDGRLRARRAD